MDETEMISSALFIGVQRNVIMEPRDEESRTVKPKLKRGASFPSSSLVNFGFIVF